MKHRRSIVWRILIGIPVLLALLFALLQSRPGKVLLAKGISKAVGRGGNVRIEIGRISGLIPARIELESLAIGDRDGLWLKARRLHLHWAMRDLFDGVVNIEALGAESIQLLRFPTVGKSGKPETQKRGFQTLEIKLGRLDVEQLLVDKSLSGIALDYAVHAAGIRLLADGGGWSVDLQRLELGCLDSVRLDLRGRIGTAGIDLHGKLAEFDCGQLPIPGMSNFTGRVGGGIAMGGPLAAPTATATLEVLDFTTTQAALDELPDLNFHVDFDLRDGQLSGTSCITNAKAGSMQAAFGMPCAFALQPFRFATEPERLTASFKADADLGILNGLTMFNNERIGGRVAADLRFDGQAADRLLGRVVVGEGAYEHYDWGVVVRGIQAEIDAGPGGLAIKQMTATDGGAGRIAVSGTMGIWQTGMPLALQVDIEKARLIRRDEVEGTLSGSIHIGDLLARPSVEGRLVVDRADILLDNIAPPEARLLIPFDETEPPTHETAVAASRKPLPFSMDVVVSMPDQIFVNASVVDSVWGGELRLRDAPGGIAVSGVIQPKRGYLSFIGKKFRLMDEGRIDLDGSIPPSPSMNIAAEYSRSDIVAHLALTGKLNNPTYTLTSTPALPEDEVLSHVLFGRDTSAISPYQAFQIAAAARQLSGGVNGPGFMYRIRHSLGVDTLEWREPETADGRSAVAAGKYVVPGLYVEVKSTLGEKEGSTGMMAEYELTRHFSVETSTGPTMRPGIGVNWKIDY